ncbi:hypothetical protein [Arenibacter palladensis]|uniref:hypothetical protein n=1 Tax=Arenibacter palladensis TaxID=237373 RepID=UPI0026E4011F|nr:hypothetical protein [Arenibacter palladensis]MDO6604153.1 hypothetical protein [Arenibacter palladensis]
MEIVKGFNSNIWFQNSGNLIGELALINLYAMAAGISEEMAMHSFGLIENFFLGLVLYWGLAKITKSKFIAPILGVICFAFFYKYLPININLLLEHSSLYLALCFALPAMVFTVIPKLLVLEKRRYFLVLLGMFSAIGFINFFVLLVILPLFLLCALVLSEESNRQYVFRSVLSFLLGVGVVIAVNGIGCYLNHMSFYEFLRSNIIQVNSYAYYPQLIVPLEQMLMYYNGIGLIALLMVMPLFLKNRKKWTLGITFLLFLNLFNLIQYLEFDWLDMDLFYMSLSVFVSIVLGTIIGMLVYYFGISIPRSPKKRAITLTFLFFGCTIGAYFSNGYFNYGNKKSDKLKMNLLEVYDTLSSDYLPYSYAIVNQDYGQNLSINEHHFMNYSDFLNTYTKRDSIYQIYKEDKKFLEKNSEYILPNSVFVVITKSNNNFEILELGTPEQVAEEIVIQLEVLKSKGRIINVFRKDDYFTVYEIINKEKSSNLNDLILNL